MVLPLSGYFPNCVSSQTFLSTEQVQMNVGELVIK